MIIGYVRVSTMEQNEARQIKALEEYGAKKIFVDKQSGVTLNRTEFKEMMSFVREGDTVVTESFSRISRSTSDLLKTVETLTEKNVEFVSLKESVDTSTPQGKFVLTIFAALSQLEREQLLQRQREGIEIAKAAGKYRGRQPVQYDKKLFGKLYKSWKNEEMTAVAFMKKVGLKPNTFYRRVKEYETEHGISSDDKSKGVNL